MIVKFARLTEFSEWLKFALWYNNNLILLVLQKETKEAFLKCLAFKYPISFVHQGVISWNIEVIVAYFLRGPSVRN